MAIANPPVKGVARACIFRCEGWSSRPMSGASLFKEKSPNNVAAKDTEQAALPVTEVVQIFELNKQV